MEISGLFRTDYISLFVGGSVCFFSLLAVIYSVGFMRGRKGLFRYYLYLLLTAVVSLGAVFANNLLLFIVLWGFLGLLLYLLIEFGEKPHKSATAKKTFIIIGGTDAVMLLGLGIIWKFAGTLDMDNLSIPLTGAAAVAAYLCLASGAFAKAGCMPFHTWVPDTAEDAPTSVTAFLPASLDKLLGIYFFIRLTIDIFRMNAAMNIFLMALGSFTILAAVMMALVQHDLKRLLGYHAVSQVGYMVLGIGTGNPIGIAGGLFHMLNNAIYKSCLFFSGGAVEKRTGTTDLEKLGGFARLMPVTFATFLIASLSISGVPPFNGFASKWMIYQGIIDSAAVNSYLWIVWLVAAMFGSALTLASFMKLVHAVFLGQPSREVRLGGFQKKETGPSMWIPTVTLAALCVLFGVFAWRLPLDLLIFPSLGGSFGFTGIWDPSLATALIIAGLVIGLIIYYLGRGVKTRSTAPFVGGETYEDIPEMRVSGTEFYATIKEMGLLKTVYKMAEKKYFDIYEVGVKITFGFNAVLRYLHNGVLLTYLAWCMLGMIVLFFVLFKKPW